MNYGVNPRKSRRQQQAMSTQTLGASHAHDITRSRSEATPHSKSPRSCHSEVVVTVRHCFSVDRITLPPRRAQWHEVGSSAGLVLSRGTKSKSKSHRIGACRKRSLFLTIVQVIRHASRCFQCCPRVSVSCCCHCVPVAVIVPLCRSRTLHFRSTLADK